MTKRTRAIHWGRLFAASLLTVCGVAGCGRGPTAPSQPGQRPGPTAPVPPEQGNPALTILSVTPSIGSTGGGAHIKITGAGLLPSTRVAFGATNVAAWFDKYSGGIFVTTPSHAPGSVDVVVTNVDGQNAVAIGAYTFAAPESFDVNGNWRGVFFAGDYDEPLTFTVVNGAVVDFTCSTSGLVRLSPPVPIVHGEFSSRGEDGVAISGTILAPNEAMGVVNVGPVGNVRPCLGAEWHASKE
jgi:hypothetical protein